MTAWSQHSKRTKGSPTSIKVLCMTAVSWYRNRTKGLEVYHPTLLNSDTKDKPKQIHGVHSSPPSEWSSSKHTTHARALSADGWGSDYQKTRRLSESHQITHILGTCVSHCHNKINRLTEGEYWLLESKGKKWSMMVLTNLLIWWVLHNVFRKAWDALGRVIGEPAYKPAQGQTTIPH